jgi:hypothetical protein
LMQRSLDLLEQRNRADDLKKCWDPNLGPHYFIRNFVYTEDQAEHRAGVPKVKKAPYDLLPYIPIVIEEMNRIPYYDDTGRYIRALLVPKSRRLWITWCCASYVVWYAQFNAHRRCFCPSIDKDLSNILVNDKCWFIYQHEPDWMQALWDGGEPQHITTNPSASITFNEYQGQEHKSSILAVPKGETQLLSETGSLVWIDEAGDFDNLERTLTRFWPLTQPSEEGGIGGKMIITGAARVGSKWQTVLGY